MSYSTFFLSQVRKESSVYGCLSIPQRDRCMCPAQGHNRIPVFSMLIPVFSMLIPVFSMLIPVFSMFNKNSIYFQFIYVFSL